MMGNAGFSRKAGDAMLSASDQYGPAMSDTKTLYDEDFFAWTKQQAKALRAASGSGTNQPLDWKNLAEEIEDLGRSQRRELGSRIREIVEHLVKLQRSPALEPRPGWRASIRRQRGEIEDLLRDSPSLERNIEDIIREQATRGAENAIAELQDRREIAARPRSRSGRQSSPPPFTRAQILGDWFPPDPEPPARGE
jgi:hypothetical protein